jgi:hypothetical protein
MAGLEKCECDMWIVFGPLDVEEARNELSRASREAGRRLDTGDIEIRGISKEHVTPYSFRQKSEPQSGLSVKEEYLTASD